MNLVSIRTARVVGLTQLTEFNPRGKFLAPIIPALAQRYSFLSLPNLADVLKKPGESIKLGAGGFEDETFGKIAIDLAIHSDGFVVDSRADTAASDRFLIDALTWVSQEFGLKFPEKIDRRYISELYVTSTRSLGGVLRLEKFAKALSAKTTGFKDVAYELVTFGLGSDYANAPNPIPFRFERADGASFAENKYYSIGQLQTSDHLALLDELETALTP